LSGESTRVLRQRVEELLSTGEVRLLNEELRTISPRRAVNPVLSAFYHGDDRVRWNAVAVFGQLVKMLALEDMEAARVVMRRLMWSLNDESGGIGWGAPEAMGEAMACVQRLAEEYGAILLSYVREDGNFLEHAPLRKGALWGLGRLAQARPGVLTPLGAAGHIRGYLKDPDPEARALALWALGRIGEADDCGDIRHLRYDTAEVMLFVDHSFVRKTVGDAAEEAIAALCGS
jgi:hypothetical protein